MKLRRDPDCPVCGESPDDHRLRRLRRVLRASRVGTLSRVRIPPTLRGETQGEREVEASGGTVRELLDDLLGRFPALRGQLLEDDGLAAVRERLRRGRGRPHARTASRPPVEDGSTVILLPAMAGG